MFSNREKLLKKKKQTNKKPTTMNKTRHVGEATITADSDSLSLKTSS